MYIHVHVHAVYKITVGHRSISDHFMEMTVQIVSWSVLLSDHIHSTPHKLTYNSNLSKTLSLTRDVGGVSITVHTVIRMRIISHKPHPTVQRSSTTPGPSTAESSSSEEELEEDENQTAILPEWDTCMPS